MTDENPFRSPTSDEEHLAATAAGRDGDWRVVGNKLVVRSGVVLPRLCVKTGVPIGHLDRQRRVLRWCPPIFALLILLSGLLLVLIYFLASKKCEITFGLSHDVQRRRRRRRRIAFAVAISAFLAMPLAGATDIALLTLVSFFSLIGSIIYLLITSSPIAVAKHRLGEFWISGCSPEFLSQLG